MIRSKVWPIFLIICRRISRRWNNSKIWVMSKMLTIMNEINVLKPIFGIFKSNILKFIRPTPGGFFKCYKHKRIRLMTRLRLGLSYLCEHKFNHSFQNSINPLCSCGMVWMSNNVSPYKRINILKRNFSSSVVTSWT